MSWTDPFRNAAAGGFKLVGAQGVAEDISRGDVHDALVASNPETKYDRKEAVADLAGLGDQYREGEAKIGEVGHAVSKAKEMVGIGGLPSGADLEQLAGSMSGAPGLSKAVSLGKEVLGHEGQGAGAKGVLADLDLGGDKGAKGPDLAGLAELPGVSSVLDKVSASLPSGAGDLVKQGMQMGG